MNISLFAFAPENLVSRDGFGSPVPRQPAHLHTLAESGAYLRDSLKKNHTTPRPSEHPPVMGEKMSKRLPGRWDQKAANTKPLHGI